MSKPKSVDVVAEPARSPEGDADASARDAAQRALCSSLRRVMERARVSAAPPAVSEQARALLAEAAELLAPWADPGPYSQAKLGPGPHRLDENARDPAVFFPYSPVVGAKNPLSPPIAFRSEGESV